MNASRFAELKVQITGEATAEQCLELEELVRKISAEKQGEMVVARRFRCRQSPGGGCGKTFNVFIGTPLARMRKPQEWARHASLMATRFVSIDTIRDTGIDISRLIAWRWRPRLLKLQAERQPETLSGVIEADETFFRSSFKGSRQWKRGNPPENRPPRYRGGPAMTARLSSEQIPVLTAIAANGGSIEVVLTNRTGIGPTLTGRIASVRFAARTAWLSASKSRSMRVRSIVTSRCPRWITSRRQRVENPAAKGGSVSGV